MNDKETIMEKKEIIIKVCNERIFLNLELSIPIHNTNLSKELLIFPKPRVLYCKVEMLNYKSDEKSLKVKVKQYYLTDITGFNFQKPTRVIEKLLFENFDLSVIETVKYGYDHATVPLQIIPSTNESTLSQLNKESNVWTIKEEYRIGFNKTHFNLGSVSFSKYVKKINQEVEFKIANDHILEEFDAIKVWFSKILKIKKIKVTITIVMTENEISGTHASSEDIDQISPELIDSVKFERISSLMKAPGIPDHEKLLFTLDELFSQIDSDNTGGNVFNQTETDILDIFLQKKNIRNKKQLEYLASKKQSKKHKLRYTLNPNFGFLFTIEGINDNHFVWELLNSHATYLWRMAKSDEEIDRQIKRIENEINEVRTIKRVKYKKAYKNNFQGNDIGFCLISHEDINSNPTENFVKWKSKLYEQLT